MKKTILSLLLLNVMMTFVFGEKPVWCGQDKKSDSNTIYSPVLFESFKYRCIGPTRGGRVTAVAGIASRPSTFYMGSVGGGVWKTTDYGQRWTNVSDGFLETGSIGAIRVSPSDPDIIYVGTGSDGIRSNVITGRGVYKSTDAGKNWQFVGLRNVGQIGAVEIHPENPDLVCVAAMGHAFGPGADRGVYRSKDGGGSWEKLLFISDSTGAVDLELCPDNPAEIYASMWRAERKPWTIISGAREGGVYKSTDGGDTWTQLTQGLPGGLIGKSDLAVTQADPNRVYVLMEAPVGEGGLYRSDDRGVSFQLVSTFAPLLDRPFYYCNIDADPIHADILYVNSTRFFKSTDGGENWQQRSTPHGDNHDMWINPNDPDVYIQANDGGVNVTRDGGKTWSTQRNQPTAELYQVAVDDQYPYWVYAGQQDNSTIMVPSAPPYSPAAGPMGFWRAIGGCETGPAIPKPGNHNIVYANCKGRFGRYNKLTGQEKQYYVGAANMYGTNPRDLKFRFQRVSPIHVSPHDPDVVYHASQYLHKTTDEGVTWETISPDLTAFDPTKQVISGSPITRDITGEEFYSTIYAVQESSLEKGLIWVGANDGPVHVTRDGGKTWENVTPSDLPPGGRVQTIEPSPHQANKAYFAVYRYLLDDWKPYIYRTDDYGKSWDHLTTGNNGIPIDSPTRVIREDPNRAGLLYAGTEFGMYISFDDGMHWQPFQLNLPATPVTDIRIHREDLVLSTMGRSFWILDNLTLLHQLNTSVERSESYLFTPRDACRNFRRAFGRSASVPGTPPTGVMIDYFMGDDPSGEISLEILNENGQLVRGFSSQRSDIDLNIPDDFQLKGVDLRRMGGQRISSRAGMHRFLWDMRHAGSWHADKNRAGRGGPMVSPGMYQVKLTMGEWSHTEKFNVLIDPRVVEDGVTRSDLVDQESLNLRIRDLLGRARMVETRMTAVRELLKKKIEKNDRGAAQARSADEQLAKIQSRFVTAGGRYPQPMLLDQINYLSRMLDRADQKPGRDAYERCAELEGMLAETIAGFNKILKTF